MKSISGGVRVVGVLVLILWAPLAVAAPVTVQVTGRVTRSDFATIGVDSLVTGYYHYDDATPDGHPSEYNGVYEPVTLSLSFVDGSTISSDEAWIWVNNDSTGSGTIDEYAVNFEMYHPSHPDRNTLTGSFAGLDVHFGARLYRNDPTGLAWDGVALPDPESVLSLLPNDQCFLSLIPVPDMPPLDYYLFFQLTDLSVIPTVPAPGALVLAGIGLVGVRWLRRRRTL